VVGLALILVGNMVMFTRPENLLRVWQWRQRSA